MMGRKEKVAPDYKYGHLWVESMLNFWAYIDLLLMVQKSGGHQLSLLAYAHSCEGLIHLRRLAGFQPSTVGIQPPSLERDPVQIQNIPMLDQKQND